MKFALFYEIPVARPWTRDSERKAYHDVLAQAVAADRAGWHGLWTVEHHFLEEFSHCSNPEVLYGAVAARTENLRIGYGVRLQPQPYNHPVRSAESAAVLDLISNGRVDYGTGRSTTRIELEGFGIHPKETRAMWRESVEATIGCWTNDEHAFEGKYWQMPRRRVLPKPVQDPHPPLIAGGSAKPRGAALAAQWADEYNTVYATLEECRERRERVAAACAEAGRDPIRFSLMTSFAIDGDPADHHPAWIVGSLGQMAAQLEALEAAGVDRIMLQHLQHDDLEAVELIGRELIPAVS
jgi:alkanesulfonate monooxygenase SsuD/methylene tetrahydromethanopterin reductase-like flavin-dependent oxidoreductase (luciferase family)